MASTLAVLNARASLEGLKNRGLPVTLRVIDDAIRLVLADDDDCNNELVRSIVQQNDRFEDACNVLSVSVAERLVSGSLGYADADHIMNWVWSYITGWLARGGGSDAPQPSFSIYEAVDAGEYRHKGDSDQVDPVEKYTLPSLRAVLRNDGLSRLEGFEL